ncbi:MAG: hypothetical protein HYS55_03770 [Candidatus Omnitrophica bacterium]|nr:hypothetical protein [Candidatus Omnitrophota bacterium]
MRNSKLMIIMLVLGLTLFQATAMAEMIQGKIANLDLQANILTISRLSPATGVMEDLKISLTPAVELSGLNSLGELKPGDEVKVEVEKDEAGAFQAKAIEISKPIGPAEEIPATTSEAPVAAS